MADTPSSQLVSDWFAERFRELHPKLQELHLHGGELEGEITLTFGRGVAGMLGRRLARKMRLPESGKHRLHVTISHDHQNLYWSRCFNSEQAVTSTFTPEGTIHSGCWVETTGPLTLRLRVSPRDGAWHWQTLGIRLFKLPVPKCWLPKTTAYKKIDNGKYRFFVAFSLPVIGELVCYQGDLVLIGAGARAF